jgi:hypothetical protein
MALFGPAARLERCLWWQELIHWPNGASASDRAGCYDRTFGGRTSGTGNTMAVNDPRKQLSTTTVTTPVIPRNDLLVALVLVAVAWLMYRNL